MNPNHTNSSDEHENLSFILNDVDYLVGKYRDFDIAPINREASIVSLTLKGNNIQKSAKSAKSACPVAKRIGDDKINPC